MLFLPIGGDLAAAHFPVYLGDDYTRVGLAQGECDLCLGKLSLFHGTVPWFQGTTSARFSLL
jgi:hypothetical protein